MLIREIRDRHGLSQSKIAHLMGCNQSWVARRLGIIDCLSDEILDLVRKGHISTWAAARVLAPMARAIPGHAHILAEQLAKNPISTRYQGTTCQPGKRPGRGTQGGTRGQMPQRLTDRQTHSLWPA
jgi:hypothetical protein